MDNENILTMDFSSLRVIVTGLIAQYPLGGVTWDYLQYVIGLHRLGHDVYYLEDTGEWPYNPAEGGLASEDSHCAYNVSYLERVMARFGLEDRWAYRFTGEDWYGMSDPRRRSVVDSADLLINVSGTLQHPGDYGAVARLAYIDSDPVFTQIHLLNGDSQDDPHRRGVDAHDVHFSFGECLPGTLPPTDYNWRPTRQPVVLPEWTHETPHSGKYTTVMNWTSYEGLEFDGQTYGQKNSELMRFVDLPAKIDPVTLELAVNEGKTEHPPREILRSKGWTVVNPDEVCPDMDSYREYIQTSKGEWSVAKNGYVRGQTGWFSCRSACYLAAGRPVIVQDTGFAPVIPVGEGVMAFSTMNEAVEAIREVESDYDRHSSAARQIAREYFDAETVLSRLIERAFEPTSNYESTSDRMA